MPSDPIWVENAIFFVGMHAAGAVGAWSLRPFSSISWATTLLFLLSWQLASFGITIGYHRLWSHRSFTARRPLRVVLSIMGSLGFQGSIKWWVLRHRLHHRFTDDPVHDPYAATRGLFFSHMGWIFIKPKYERLKLIDKDDLDSDPIVRLQHKYYVPIAVFFGLIVPGLVASLWGDALGGFIWGGIIARIVIWHCTFIINSLAHWDGLQPYSDEVTARGNFLMAFFTSGEGNHNFHHAFPHDFRAGYTSWEWDPSKWIILTIARLTNQIPSVKTAKDEDVLEAAMYMKERHEHPAEAGPDAYQVTAMDTADDSGVDGLGSPPTVEGWTDERIMEYAAKKGGSRCCLLVLDGWLVDATSYSMEHPGGAALLRKYALRISDEGKVEGGEAGSWAFFGGMNNHSRSARKKMRAMRVGRIDRSKEPAS